MRAHLLAYITLLLVITPDLLPSARAELQSFAKIEAFPSGPTGRALSFYDGWYEIDGDFSWDVTRAQSASNPSGTVVQAGDLTLSTTGRGDDLNVTMPLWLKEMVNPSKPLQTLTLHLMRRTEDSIYAHYRLELAKSRVVAVSHKLAPGLNTPSLAVRISYQGLKLEHHFAQGKKPKTSEFTVKNNQLKGRAEDPSREPITVYADFALQIASVTGQSGSSTNEPPGLSGIPDLVFKENHTGRIQFEAVPTPGSSRPLRLVAAASNPLLYPDHAFTFTQSTNNLHILSMEPIRNTIGTSEIILRAYDGERYAENRFNVRVNSGNKQPVIAPALRSITMDENTSTTVGFVIGDEDTPLNELTLSVSSDNPDLFPSVNTNLVISVGDFENSRNLLIQPAPGKTGTATITITLEDHKDLHRSFSTTRAFKVTVNTFPRTGPTNITLPIEILDILEEGLPSGTVLGDLSATPPPSTGSYHFTLIDDAGGRFGINTNNQLVVVNGELLDREEANLHAIIIEATDEAGNSFARKFSLPLIDVNDPPIFRYFHRPIFVEPQASRALPSIVVTDQDAGFVFPVKLSLACLNGTLHVDETLLNPGAVVSNDTSTVTVNALINPITTLLTTTNAITYTPHASFSGNDTVSITVNDQNSPSTTNLKGPAESRTLNIDLLVYANQFLSWSFRQHGYDSFDEFLETQLWGLAANKDNDLFANLFEYGLGFDSNFANYENPIEPGLITGGALNSAFQVHAFAAKENRGANNTLQHNTISFVVRQDPKLSAWVEVANRLTPLPDWTTDVSQIELYSRTPLGNGFERLIFRDLNPTAGYRTYRLAMRYDTSL